jgi:hypothetical protein
MSRTKPLPPPFRIGDRIRYSGGSSFGYGDHPMVETGDEGRVVENVDGQWGRPDLGEKFARPLDGYSVVEIKGNRMAIDAESAIGRYARIGGE